MFVKWLLLLFSLDSVMPIISSSISDFARRVCNSGNDKGGRKYVGEKSSNCFLNQF